MEYREIVAVTGLGGLFQLLATKSDGAIVRNLADKTTKFISARMHNVTPLESIEVYTITDNVRLHEVFQKMKDNESTTKVLDGKADNNAVKAYFKSVYPEFDEERVYVSDMKKMLKWYEILKASDLLNFDALKQTAETAETEEATEEKPAKKATKKAADTEEAEEKPAKKASKKAAADADGEEKPAKKATKKAADTEDGEEKPAKKTARKKKED